MRTHTGTKVLATRRMKQMKNKLVACSVALLLSLSASYGQNQPASKVTAKTANITLLPKTSGTSDWVTLLSNAIKTANQKDLFVSASFEVGLFTQTKTTSKNMTTDTSTATANVQVRVLIDGNVVQPGSVV